MTDADSAEPLVFGGEMKLPMPFRRFQTLDSWNASAGSAPERVRRQALAGPCPHHDTRTVGFAVPGDLAACLFLPDAEPGRARQSVPTPWSVRLGASGYLCSLEFSQDGRRLRRLVRMDVSGCGTR